MSGSYQPKMFDDFARCVLAGMMDETCWYFTGFTVYMVWSQEENGDRWFYVPLSCFITIQYHDICEVYINRDGEGKRWFRRRPGHPSRPTSLRQARINAADRPDWSKFEAAGTGGES